MLLTIITALFTHTVFLSHSIYWIHILPCRWRASYICLSHSVSLFIQNQCNLPIFTINYIHILGFFFDRLYGILYFISMYYYIWFEVHFFLTGYQRNFPASHWSGIKTAHTSCSKILPARRKKNPYLKETAFKCLSAVFSGAQDRFGIGISPSSWTNTHKDLEKKFTT